MLDVKDEWRWNLTYSAVQMAELSSAEKRVAERS